MVDDEELVRVVAEKILTRAGFRVLIASGARGALDMCAANRAQIDLLLTDIKMPVMDGRELARCLGAHYPDLPILFMSAYQSDSPAKDALTSEPRLDGHALIRKPFKPEQLVEAVRMLIPN